MWRRVPFLPWVGRGSGAAICVLAAVSLVAAEGLFPTPLHIVRKIEDPIAKATITVHEYCAGNRIATANGEHVAIVDYEAQQIIEIDRRAATYSITRFEEVARAQPKAASAAPATNQPHVEIGVDRRYELSRDAVEALIGAAYPSQRPAEHDALLDAARAPRERIAAAAHATRQESYAIPSSQVTTIELAGQSLVMRNTVVAVTSDLAPPELLAIPPGAKQVESRITRAARELRELDRQ